MSGRFRGAKSFDNAMISLLRNHVPTCSVGLVPRPRQHAIRAVAQATNAAARAELCYVSLASPALSLQATSTHISSLHEHVAARKILESLKKLVRPWPEQPDWLRRPCDSSMHLEDGNHWTVALATLQGRLTLSNYRRTRVLRGCRFLFCK